MDRHVGDDEGGDQQGLLGQEHIIQHHDSVEDAPPIIADDTDDTLDRAVLASQILACLYIGHFLTRWGSRMWEFAVSLFMIEIWPSSLLFTSLYGLMEDLSVVSMGVNVGKWVDTTSRLKVIRVSLAMRNASVIAASLALIVLLLNPSSTLGRSKPAVALTILVDAFGGVSALAALATNIAVERDWVLAITEKAHVTKLTEMNSVMRSIDLSCKLLAPVVVGFVMSFMSVLAAAIFISVWSVLSIGFEYFLLSSVYHKTPELQARTQICDKDVELQSASDYVQVTAVSPTYINEGNLAYENNQGPEDPKANDDDHEQIMLHADHEIAQVEKVDVEQSKHTPEPTFLRLIQLGWRNLSRLIDQSCNSSVGFALCEGWKVYVRQEMVLAALSLSLLYFTVLSFGSLMTAALNWKGIPAYILGLARAVSALVGISATVAYPRVHACLQTIRTGLWSLSFQWIVLALCVVSNWVPGMIASSTLLMAGVAVSRFGLWMFDLVVLQLMQESVPESERGIVGGVQNSLQSFFEMMFFFVGMIISSPKDFNKLVFLSYSAVTLSLVLYSIQVYRVRGHLFHIHYVFKYHQISNNA